MIVSAPTYILRGSGTQSDAGDIAHIMIPEGTIIIPTRVLIVADNEETSMQVIARLSTRGTLGSGGTTVMPMPTGFHWQPSACSICRSFPTTDATGTQPIILVERGGNLSGDGWSWDGSLVGWRIGAATSVTQLVLTIPATPPASVQLRYEVEWAEFSRNPWVYE